MARFSVVFRDLINTSPAVRITGEVALGHAGNDIGDTPLFREDSRVGEEEVIPSVHEGIRRPLFWSVLVHRDITAGQGVRSQLI